MRCPDDDPYGSKHVGKPIKCPKNSVHLLVIKVISSSNIYADFCTKYNSNAKSNKKKSENFIAAE
jgi:hypothetical protein